MRTYPPEAQSPTDELLTDETPAQAQVLLMMGTFASPSSAITLSMTPVTPPTAPPAGFTQDSNAYRIVAVDSGGAMVQPTADNPVTVVLRGAGGNAALTMYVDTGGAWTALKTFNAGCGYTFEAVSPKLGVFALFRSSSASGGGGGGGAQPGGAPVALIAGIVIVVLIAGVVAVARVRHAAPPPRRRR